jgi:CheY-like chemotaxis protein
MSGYEDEQPLAIGREAFVKKPFTLEQLTSAVRRLLDA